jgi:hypothetical protein
MDAVTAWTDLNADWVAREEGFNRLQADCQITQRNHQVILSTG